MLPFHWWQSNHHELRRHHMVSHTDQHTHVEPKHRFPAFQSLTLCFFFFFFFVVAFFAQCTVGYRDESTDHSFLGPHRWCHESVPFARPAHLRVGSLRRFNQTVGHQGQHVPADLHGPRIGHQRCLCECPQGLDALVGPTAFILLKIADYIFYKCSLELLFRRSALAVEFYEAASLMWQAEET